MNALRQGGAPLPARGCRGWSDFRVRIPPGGQTAALVETVITWRPTAAPGEATFSTLRRRLGPARRRRDRDREDAQRDRAARAAAPRDAPERRPALMRRAAVSCGSTCSDGAPCSRCSAPGSPAPRRPRSIRATPRPRTCSRWSRCSSATSPTTPTASSPRATSPAATSTAARCCASRTSSSLHADALRAGHLDGVIAFAKGRALERLRAFDLAADAYRIAAEREPELAAEALRSAELCDALRARPARSACDLARPGPTRRGLARAGGARRSRSAASRSAPRARGARGRRRRPRTTPSSCTRRSSAPTSSARATSRAAPQPARRRRARRRRAAARGDAPPRQQERAAPSARAGRSLRGSRDGVRRARTRRRACSSIRREFQDLVDSGARVYEMVAARDGTPEKHRGVAPARGLPRLLALESIVTASRRESADGELAGSARRSAPGCSPPAPDRRPCPSRPPLAPRRASRRSSPTTPTTRRPISRRRRWSEIRPARRTRRRGSIATTRSRRRAAASAAGSRRSPHDVANAAQHPGRAYLPRRDVLLARDDLDPALRERLEREAAAIRSCSRDAAHPRRARHALRPALQRAGRADRPVDPHARRSRPTGSALARWTTRSTSDREDALPLQRRQALAHWKEFLARNPDAPESPAVAKQAAQAEQRWHETAAAARCSRPRSALEADGRPAEALRASRSARCASTRGRRRAARCASGRSTSSRRSATRRRAASASSCRRARRSLPDGRARARARAARARRRRRGRRRCDPARIARSPTRRASPRRSPRQQARPGGARRRRRREQRCRAAAGPWRATRRSTLADPLRNPWPHFQAARRRDRRTARLLVLAGPRRGFPQRHPMESRSGCWTCRGWPRPSPRCRCAWSSCRGSPPPPTARATAVQARRYLALHPHGEHAEEVRDWLEDYEARPRQPRRRAARGGDRASRRRRSRDAARGGRAADARRRRARKSASICARAHARRRGARYPGDRGRPARRGSCCARRSRRATPQRIAISRGFLLENPEVAGPRGLGLAPALLDGDARNGELHPDGVALVGGRELELALLAPVRRRGRSAGRRSAELGEEQLARLVARLEETSFRNALLDADDPVVPDAQRDVVFERARLGLADDVDARPRRAPSYTYRGMRERYGMVRGREPLLPFDLVRAGLARRSLARRVPALARAEEDAGRGALRVSRVPRAAPGRAARSGARRARAGPRARAPRAAASGSPGLPVATRSGSAAASDAILRASTARDISGCVRL